MQINDITHEILDSAYKVHSALGPGLLESAYRTCLVYELRKKLKTVEAFTDVHTAQVLTYLKLSKNHVGLLLNFYTKSLKDGIKRLIL